MRKTELHLQNIMCVVGTLIAGLILPLFLIPIIALTGYSEIVEEMAKALVVYFIILRISGYFTKIITGAMFGFLFGLSESMFYLSNVFAYGDVSVIWQRLIWTVPMHIGTVLAMISIALRNKRNIIFGFIVALLLHLLFNNMVVLML